MKYFLLTLGLILIVLKLINQIDWSWWLVWSPVCFYCLWVIFAVTVAILAKAVNEANKPPTITYNPNGKSKFQQRLDEYMEQQRKIKNQDKSF